MTTLTLHARGPASPEQAWDRYAVPARWPDWAPQITRVEASGARIAPMMSGRVHGPLGMSVPFAIDEVDELGRRWTWHVRLGPIRLRLRHGVDEDDVGDRDGRSTDSRRSAGGPGSRTWLTVDGPLPVVVGYAPIARLALGRLVAR